MRKTSLGILLIMLMLNIKGYSQVGITAYSIRALGFNTSQNVRISGELKIFANRPYEDLMFELDCFYNLKAKEYHRFSIGLGLNVAPFMGSDNIYALTIPASIEIFPIKDLKRVSVLFELAPEILGEGDLDLRFLWGIRYSFLKQK